MKFSIGDRILLKRTGEEGHVVAYISPQMLEVEVNGTTFPVYMDEVDHPYLKWFTEKKQQKTTKDNKTPEQLPVEKPKQRPPKLAKGIYLSFLPVFKANEMEDIVESLKVYMLNEYPVPVRFSYDMRIGEKSVFSHTGKLHAFEHLYLHNVLFEDMNEQPRFNWELTEQGGEEKQKAEGVLRIRPAKLFAHINELLQKNEPMFSYMLVEDFLPAEKAKKEEKPETFIPPTTRNNRITALNDIPRYELDLHIEALVNDTKGLSNADIMDIQLRELRRQVDIAIRHRQERMMVIHGLGKGILREEVHKILKQVPEISHFANEWQGQYGFGATEVFFKY